MMNLASTKIAFAAVASLSGAFACMAGGDAARAAEPPSSGAEVMAVKAVTYCFTDTIAVTGMLVAREEAIVNLDADGYRISEILVKEGRRSRKSRISLSPPGWAGRPGRASRNASGSCHHGAPCSRRRIGDA